MEIVTLAARPELRAALEAPELNPGPEFIYHDAVSARWWRAFGSALPEFHVVLVDGTRVVAHGRAIPLAWSDDASLPDEGWDFALERGWPIERLAALLRSRRRSGSWSPRTGSGRA